MNSKSASAPRLCALRSSLAWHSGMLDVMFVMQGLGSFAIALGGSDELRGATLPAVARGNAVCAFAVFHGTHSGEGGPVAPTGNPVATDYVYVIEFDGDRIRHGADL